MFEQVREMIKARSETKRVESEMKKVTAEYSNGGITIVVRGDMTVEKLAVTPSAYEEVVKGKPQRFETMLLNVINGGIKRAREEVQRKMMALMQQPDGPFKGFMGK